MEYFPIPPIGLREVVERKDNAFILAQFWSHEEYRNYYLENHWRTVIVDNGVYEGAPVRDELLIDIAKKVKADRCFVVAPESEENSTRTLKMAKDFIDLYGSNAYDIMVTLQAESPVILKDFVKQLDKYDIAYAIPVKFYRKGWCRAGILRWLNLRDRYVHAFGLDNLLELNELHGLIQSIDTSMPFTAAYHGMDLKYNLLVKVKRVNLLATKFDQQVISLAKKNLETMYRWCNGYVSVD